MPLTHQVALCVSVREGVRACVTPFPPHTDPAQRKKDASAVTHLYRLQAGEGWSEVQPAAEAR